MRTPRKISEADIYHVIARGTGRQIIFEDDSDREKFLDLLDGALDNFGAELLAWCLMGNHVHLLIHAPIERVSNLMKHLCGSYSLWFNRKCGRCGHLFQERFKSEPIDTDGYLVTAIRYIHDNPEKAGIASAGAYRWSSYAEYNGNPIRCQTDFVTEIFGKEVFDASYDAENGTATCMDIDLARSAMRALPDADAIVVAQETIGVPIDALKTLPVDKRNAHLRSLKAAGLSVRQIERLSGIGRNTVYRA